MNPWSLDDPVVQAFQQAPNALREQLLWEVDPAFELDQLTRIDLALTKFERIRQRRREAAGRSRGRRCPRGDVAS